MRRERAADLLFVADDLETGAPVAPFGGHLSSNVRLCLVSKAHRADEPDVAAFRHWLVQEIAVTTARAQSLIQRLAGGDKLPIMPAHPAGIARHGLPTASARFNKSNDLPMARPLLPRPAWDGKTA